MSEERSRAAKWVKGQLRLYCVNDFDDAREIRDDMPVMQKREGRQGFVSDKDFMLMLEVARLAKEANDANIMAVLKRTHLFVNTQTFLYARPAGEEKKPVIRILLGDKCDFLHQDSRHMYVYDYHRKGGTDLRSDFEGKLQWEASWMSAAMAGRVSG